MLALYDANSDVVLIGDPDVTEATWKRIGQLERNCIELKAELKPDFEYLYDYTRLDHFIGFTSYYAIEQGKTAAEGSFKFGPGLV